MLDSKASAKNSAVDFEENLYGWEGEQTGRRVVPGWSVGGGARMIAIGQGWHGRCVELVDGIDRPAVHPR